MSLVFVFVCLVVLITNTFKFVTSQINLVLLHVYLTVKPKEMTYANMADHCRPTENWVQNCGPPVVVAVDCQCEKPLGYQWWRTNFTSVPNHCQPTRNWVQDQWTTSGIGSRLPVCETTGLPVVKILFDQCVEPLSAH